MVSQPSYSENNDLTVFICFASMNDCSQQLISFDTSILKVMVETKVIIITSSDGLFLQFHPNFKHNRFQQWMRCVKIYTLRYNIVSKKTNQFPSRTSLPFISQ